MAHSGPASTRLRSSTRSFANAPLFGRCRSVHHFFLAWFSSAASSGQILLHQLLVAHAELVEVRLALFEKRLHALDRFLAAPDLGQQLHAMLPRGIKLVGFEVQRLLGGAQRLRRMRLYALAPFFGRLAQLRLGNHLVDEADARRLFRAELAGQEDHLLGQPLAKNSRQILRRSHRRACAHGRARLSEDGIIGGDDQIAPQRQLVAAAHACPLNHGNHRNGQPANRHRQTQHAVVPMAGIGAVQPHHRIKVAAGRKCPARSRHHCAGNRGVVAG